MENIQEYNKKIKQILEDNNYTVLNSKTCNILQDNQHSIENKLHYYYYLYQAIQSQNNQQVSIKVSKNDRLSYDRVKYEAKALEKLNHFECFLKYIGSLDLEDQSIYILITEDYDRSLEDGLNDSLRTNQLEDIVKLLYVVVNSLIEINFFGYIHYNIKPSSIVITKEGLIKLTDITSFHCLQEIYKGNQKDLQDNIYLSPELKDLISNYSLDSDSKCLPYNSDIYSLGIVILQLLGNKVNQQMLSQIQSEKHEQVFAQKTEIDNAIYNFQVFISITMLNKQSNCRCTSFNITRYLRKLYTKQTKKYNLIERRQKIKEYYLKNSIQPDQYFWYNQCILRQIAYNYDSINPFKLLEKENSELYAYILQEIAICNLDNELSSLTVSLESLKIRENLFQGNHQQIAESLSDIGISHQTQQKYEESTLFYQRCYEMRMQLFGEGHLFSIKTLLNIGDQYRWQGEKKKAFASFEKAFMIASRLFKSNHDYIIEILDHIIGVAEQEMYKKYVLIKLDTLLMDKNQIQEYSIKQIMYSFNNFSQKLDQIKFLKIYEKKTKQVLSKFPITKKALYHTFKNIYANLDDMEKSQDYEFYETSNIFDYDFEIDFLD